MLLRLATIITLGAVVLDAAWAAPTPDQMLQFLEQYNKVRLLSSSSEG